MALYVDPRTGSLRDVIIWIVEELKKLKAQVYKLSQGGGSGGNQNIQSVMENGDFYIGNMDPVRPTAFGMVPGRSGVALVKDGNGLNIVDGNGSFVLTDLVDNNTTTKVNFNLVDGQDIEYSFPSDKLSGSYVIATLDDITGGTQDLDQTLGNGNESSYDIHLTDDAGIYVFTPQFPEDEVASLNASEQGGRLTLNNVIDDSLKFNYIIPNPDQVGTGTFYLPVGDGDAKVLATLEDLGSNRTQGVQTITLDGMSSIYTIAHGLGQVPVFAYAGRGNSTNFDVFNTTWDGANITITYENPPIAGTLDINWVALK